MNSHPITQHGPNDSAPGEPPEFNRREYCELVLEHVMSGEAVEINGDLTVVTMDIEMALAGDEKISALNMSALEPDADLLHLGNLIQDRARFVALQLIDSHLDRRVH